MKRSIVRDQAANVETYGLEVRLDLIKPLAEPATQIIHTNPMSLFMARRAEVVL